VAILLAVLRRREGTLRGREIARSVIRSGAAAVVMGAALVAALRFADPAAMRGLPAAATLGALIAAATALYWFAAHLLGAPEPAELSRVVRRRRA